MRISRHLLLGLALAVIALPGSAVAQNSTVRVTEAYAPPAQAGRAAAAFMKMQGGPDRLISASSDSAGRVELHETVVDNGVLSMRPVGGVLVDPGVATRLAPAGLHIMLLDLKRPLKEGETLSLTLVFERAGKMTFPVAIARNATAVRPSVAVPGLRGSPR